MIAFTSANAVRAIRERFEHNQRSTPEAVLDQSINQTLSRTVMTSGTTLLVVTVLFVLGGAALKGFSTALIVGFGALTILLGDPTFVQIKPTIIYSVFGIVLLAGFFTGRGLLKILLEAAFEGLSDEGWLKLSRNWGVFFLVLAALNEVLRAQMSFEGWLWAKFWVFLPLTFIFTFANIPMLLKHGLDVGQADDTVKDEPPTA